MDPISITGACVSLLFAIGRTSVAVTGFIRDCREARSDLTGVTRELSDLKLVLELLKDDTDVQDGRIIPEALRIQILSIIAHCDNVLRKIDQLLEKHSGTLGATRWAVDGKKDATNLLQSLEAYRGALSLAVETVNLALTKEVKADTIAIRVDTAEIRQDTSLILSEIARLRELIPNGDVAGEPNFLLQRYLDALTNYAETVCEEASHDHSDGKNPFETLSRHETDQGDFEDFNSVAPIEDGDSTLGLLLPLPTDQGSISGGPVIPSIPPAPEISSLRVKWKKGFGAPPSSGSRVQQVHTVSISPDNTVIASSHEKDVVLIRNVGMEQPIGVINPVSFRSLRGGRSKQFITKLAIISTEKALIAIQVERSTRQWPIEVSWPIEIWDWERNQKIQSLFEGKRNDRWECWTGKDVTGAEISHIAVWNGPTIGLFTATDLDRRGARIFRPSGYQLPCTFLDLTEHYFPGTMDLCFAPPPRGAPATLAGAMADHQGRATLFVSEAHGSMFWDGETWHHNRIASMSCQCEQPLAAFDVVAIATDVATVVSLWAPRRGCPVAHNILAVWDTAEGAQHVFAIPPELEAAALSPDARLLACHPRGGGNPGEGGSKIMLASARTGAWLLSGLPASDLPHEAPATALRDVRFSGDGRLLVVGYDGGDVELYEIEPEASADGVHGSGSRSPSSAPSTPRAVPGGSRG